MDLDRKDRATPNIYTHYMGDPAFSCVRLILTETSSFAQIMVLFWAVILYDVLLLSTDLDRKKQKKEERCKV